MFPTASLLAAVVLACSLTANAAPSAPFVGGPAKINFTARVANTTASGVRLVDADRARIDHLRAHSASTPGKDKRASYSFSVTNAAVSCLWPSRSFD
jgi:hypothetical protein